LDDSQIVLADLNLLASPYRCTPERATAVFDEIARRLNGNPVIRASASSVFQVGMTPAGHILVEGQQRQFSTTVSSLAVDERYFETMGIRLVAGDRFRVMTGRLRPR
jgi:hypothetical protein